MTSSEALDAITLLLQSSDSLLVYYPFIWAVILIRKVFYA